MRDWIDQLYGLVWGVSDLTRILLDCIQNYPLHNEGNEVWVMLLSGNLKSTISFSEDLSCISLQYRLSRDLGLNPREKRLVNRAVITAVRKAVEHRIKRNRKSLEVELKV